MYLQLGAKKAVDPQKLQNYLRITKFVKLREYLTIAKLEGNKNYTPSTIQKQSQVTN